jgi:N-acetylneuraminic acid mutarotase
MTAPRAGHTAVRLNDGRVLILGGYGAAALFAEVFNPTNETFTPVTSSVTTDRASLVAERFPDGTVLIAGGESSETTFSDQVLRYNPATNTMTVAMVRLPQPTSFAQSALLPDGRMGMFGGIAANQFIGLNTAYAVGNTGSDATVASLPAIPDGRVLHTVTRLADGRTLIVGGAIGLGFAPTVYLFD